MPPRRARSDDDKRARHAEILDAARGVFDATEVDAFTMDAVAITLGLAKGTLYRYFPTREALLLALVHDEYSSWFDSVDAGLDEGERSVDEVLVDAILAQPRFLRLVPLVPTVLERNIPLQTAANFKRDVMARLRATATRTATRLDIGEGRALQLLVHVQASVIGLCHHANPAPVVRQLLADPDFAGLRLDLRTELTHSIRALLRAATTPV